MRPRSFLALLGALSLSGDQVLAAGNLTSLVNLFIGTASGAGGASGGNAFPGTYPIPPISIAAMSRLTSLNGSMSMDDTGSAIPHAMAKVGIDVSTTPRQAGYISDNSSITGISLMHDEGTGGNIAGGYGIFPLFPLQNCAFTSCSVGIAARSMLRAAGKDAASPGYFTTTFVNGIQIETTSTRRAGLIRFTFPPSATPNNVVVDLTNDLQRSFHGGSLLITPDARVKLGGTFMQSYGTDNYTVFACYDFLNANPTPAALLQYGTYQSASTSSPANISVNPSGSSLVFPFTPNTNPTQAGALLSFNTTANNDRVTARFGISFIGPDHACANAEEEVPTWDWDGVQEASRSQWEEVLSRVQVDTEKEDPTIVELLYSSLYRASLVPANLTGENPYWSSPYPFYDALFCSWDTFRTVHPLLSILSPYEWSEIVNAYIDGWRHTGYIPECRANTKAGYVQGGSDGMPILGDFAVKYGRDADRLGVPVNDLYQALVDTAENTYALGDFAVRQAAMALDKPASDVAKYTNRSMNFVNHWDASVVHDGYKGFMQRRYANGTFAFSPPDACSPVDPTPHSCARGSDNNVGFYQSSSWEMSFFAPHSMSTIVRLMGGDEAFVNRTEHYFAKGYFQAGNEPSFQTPWLYHYANRPDLTALRLRRVVYQNFNTGIRGIPGNDDSGAMASLLVFHLLGLYPVLASTQFLLSSPFLSSYTITNALRGTRTRVSVNGFDSSTLLATPPSGSRLYVVGVQVNGVRRETVCWIGWDDLVGGGEIVIEVGEKPLEEGCGTGAAARPASLEDGGF
ncbi:hypothetical protein NLJ89_g2591 [Agrocybe chaxingu]|uniref:Glycoside hydrolase family 92 protein n=1 Tax=Agrocybe chaxingu TaxID=84603 RepID=A0A9W8K714_9AGAR|nr:hypothetical protein NLJ89_g2591 [Agrocybe chaxingu]